MDQSIVFGNDAPTDVEYQECSANEALLAGPLARREIAPNGVERHVRQVQIPLDGPSVTKFVVPHAYSLVDAVKDVAVSFGRQHSLKPPAWIWSDHDTLGQLVAQHIGAQHRLDIPLLERPPIAGGAIQAVGRSLWASALADASGETNTATGVTATTLTRTGATWTANQWTGKGVVMGGTVATILSNTSTVLTLARWETPGSRSGAAASTPSAGVYVINSGQDPAYWVALTANATTPTTGGADTTLPAEITTAGSGFLRKVPVWGYTAGTNSYTLTGTWTATGSDSFPQTVAKIGVLNAQNGGVLLFEPLLNAVFTANTTGDNVQIVETVTGT